MLIEVGAPCSLPLGLVRTQGGRTHLLGVTLQHPLTDVFAEASPQFSVTGPMAHKGYVQAQRFLAHHRLEPLVDVEIELTIPDMIGLGAETMLGLSIARALAWVHNLPFADTLALARAMGLGPEHALEVWGFDRGGLLLVDAERHTASAEIPPPVRRPITHSDQDAWAFVFRLPKIPAGTPETLEADRRAALLNAAPHLSAETGRLLEEELWPALEQDDLAAFARALMAIQQLNRQALADADAPLSFTQDEQAVLDLLRDRGAVAWGRSPTGLALYGLIKGASASVALRHHLSQHVGIYGGVVMATITDNDGARHTIREMRPIE